MAVNSIRGLGIQNNLDCLVKCGPHVEIESNAPFAAPPATSAESILAERFLNLCISRRGDTGQRAGIITFSLAPRVTSSGLGAPEAARRARVGQGGTIPSCSPGAKNGSPSLFPRKRTLPLCVTITLWYSLNRCRLPDGFMNSPKPMLSRFSPRFNLICSAIRNADAWFLD